MPRNITFNPDLLSMLEELADDCGLADAYAIRYVVEHKTIHAFTSDARCEAEPYIYSFSMIRKFRVMRLGIMLQRQHPFDF